MAITIRHAEAKDLPSIRDIYIQLHAYHGTLQQPNASLATWENRFASWGENMRCLVAEIDGQIAGQLGLMLEVNPRRKHVASFGMGVHQDFLRHGVGRALVSAAVDQCDNWLNIVRIELEVYVDNEPAIALYKSAGFEIEGTLKQFAFRAGEYVDVYSMARITTV